MHVFVQYQICWKLYIQVHGIRWFISRTQSFPSHGFPHLTFTHVKVPISLKILCMKYILKCVEVWNCIAWISAPLQLQHQKLNTLHAGIFHNCIWYKHLNYHLSATKHNHTSWDCELKTEWLVWCQLTAMALSLIKVTAHLIQQQCSTDLGGVFKNRPNFLNSAPTNKDCTAATEHT
jgi:hypothetical protein